MPRRVKADYIKAIQELGEEPPSAWTMAELQHRLHELQEEHGLLPKQNQGTTPFKSMALKLNKASKTKSDLQQFAEEELGITNVRNETIPSLQRECLKKIYMVTTPSPMDPVGFGMHSSLTYEELFESQKEYVQWVKMTAAEGQCDYRLGRLAAWIQQYEEQKEKQTSRKSPPVPKLQGKAKSISSQGSSISSETHMEMLKMIQELKEEVSALKEERPRKKAEKPDESMPSSQHSFELLRQ